MKDIDRETWQKLEPVLDQALELEPIARARFLEEVSLPEDLRSRLRALLEIDSGSGKFLDGSVADLAGIALGEEPAMEETGLAPGEKVGTYRIRRSLGKGGMGAVYLAERDDGQFDQVVALKMLSSRAPERELRARFLKERQIQAQLAHPNIARLLDGGVTAGGNPYLVMEYVDGRPITDYCTGRRASVEERIELFLQVCEAVAHANNHLVVHRDLKPSNILVTSSGEVKLVDFGIAKLLAPDVETGARTETAAQFFTPDYAAPEQIEGRPVTTASDVYSLGLVLYELLTGRRPLGHCRTPLERLGAIRDTIPTPPSRVRDREIPGKGSADLDAVCLKALRAESLERYPSAAALREDLVRYREKLPVRARQGGTAYRLRKFVRRNRVTVGALSVVMLAILVSAVVSLRQANLAAAGRDRALKAEARARAINDFLVHDMLEAAMPEESRGADLKVSEVLQAASRRIEGSLDGAPEVEADLRLVLGRAYLSLGEYETAREHAEAAVSLRGGALGENDPETLNARSDLAGVHLAMGDYAAARALLEPTLSAQRVTEGPEGLSALATEGRLAETLLQEGSFLAAESRFKDVLSRIEREHPDAWRERLLLRAGLGRALNLERKDTESEAFLRETLSLQRERLGPEHPDTLATMSLLMDALRRLLRYREAIPLAEESIRHHEALYGRGHPATLNMLTMLAGLLWFEERERVEELLLEVLDRSRESLGPEHPTTLTTLMNLAQNAKMLKKYEVAEPRYREALSLSRRLNGNEHTRTLRCLRYLAQYLADVGRDLEAREVFREILSISERMAGRPDADATFLNDYAWLLMTYVPEDMRDPVRALPLAERAVALTERKQIEFLHSLARAHKAMGRLDEAIAILREIYALPDSIHRYDVERDMVEYLAAKGDPSAVEDFLEENLARRRQARAPDDPLIAQTLRLLGLHYFQEKRYAEAEEGLRAAIEIYRMRSPEEARDVARTESELGEVLFARGRTGEAETLLVRSHRNLDGEDDLLPAARERLKKLEEALGRTLLPDHPAIEKN